MLDVLLGVVVDIVTPRGANACVPVAVIMTTKTRAIIALNPPNAVVQDLFMEKENFCMAIATEDLLTIRSTRLLEERYQVGDGARHKVMIEVR